MPRTRAPLSTCALDMIRYSITHPLDGLRQGEFTTEHAGGDPVQTMRAIRALGAKATGRSIPSLAENAKRRRLMVWKLSLADFDAARAQL